MLITSFDIKGTVHFEFIPQCQKVNQAYYVEKLKLLHEAVLRKRPQFGLTNDWIPHHGNAPAQMVLSCIYSPDLKGRRFQDTEGEVLPALLFKLSTTP
jgi:hypothetical protein